MNDKKLTDEEIITALMCHFNEELDEELFQCVDCPLYNDTSPSCTEALKSYVLDLINRQKSEIERLNKQMEWLEGYNKNLMSGNTALSEEIWIAKAESYKEFAKFLIDKTSKGLIHVSDLPDFVKEMVGEEE